MTDPEAGRPRTSGAALVSRRLRVMFWLSMTAAVSLYWWYGREQLDPGQLEVPPGFIATEFASVAGARSLAVAPDGTVYVGSRYPGLVYALRDRDGDGRAEEVDTVARGLDTPNGVALYNGALYVAEVGRILRYDSIASRRDSLPPPIVVYADLPTEELHGWRYLRFGPDGRLYVAVGAPCNICAPADSLYASILRMRPDGSEAEVYARGIRNSVGFDWNPDTGALWFSDNGRDWLGDDAPPDELNVAPGPGLHFGFPHCHGGLIPDPELANGRSCDEFTPPTVRLPAHVAALGLRFYTGTMFPESYRDRLYVAEHGSWNRSVPDGYRVIAVRVADGVAAGQEVFAEGWLRRRRAWGRPVDVAVMPDGALLVSDDLAGKVYRIAYRP